MSERPRFNSEYVRSFVFGIKLLSLLCLLAAPLLLFGLGISLGSGLLQKLPFLSKPGLSIISAQSFPYDSNDPLGIRKAEKQPIYMLKVNYKAKQARQEMARSELARRGVSTQSSNASNSGLFDLYVKTNRATTGTTEEGQLKEQAERILNDDRVIQFVPDDKMGRPGPEGHFELDGIPDYMKIIVPSETTSLGGIANTVGLISITIFCLALYFPLTKSIVDLFRLRRTAKK